MAFHTAEYIFSCYDPKPTQALPCPVHHFFLHRTQGGFLWRLRVYYPFFIFFHCRSSEKKPEETVRAGYQGPAPMIDIISMIPEVSYFFYRESAPQILDRRPIRVLIIYFQREHRSCLFQTAICHNNGRLFLLSTTPSRVHRYTMAMEKYTSYLCRWNDQPHGPFPTRCCLGSLVPFVTSPIRLQSRMQCSMRVTNLPVLPKDILPMIQIGALLRPTRGKVSKVASTELSGMLLIRYCS